jgi:hypothetical protein
MFKFLDGGPFCKWKWQGQLTNVPLANGNDQSANIVPIMHQKVHQIPKAKI